MAVPRGPWRSGAAFQCSTAVATWPGRQVPVCCPAGDVDTVAPVLPGPSSPCAPVQSGTAKSLFALLFRVLYDHLHIKGGAVSTPKDVRQERRELNNRTEFRKKKKFLLLGFKEEFFPEF